MNEEIFYHIYPLGFCGAEEENSYNKETIYRLEKIREWIPHLKYLKISALYLGPIFKSKKHGYDTTDYYKVDRRLGDNDAFKSLVAELHSNEIRVILDGVFNHIGRDHFVFQDVLKHRENSMYKDWIDGLNFHSNNPNNDGLSYGNWAGCHDLVKLNLQNHYTKEHLFNAAKFWIDEFNIDGIRLDAADSLDFNFMKELSDITKSKKQDFWLMGEVVHGDYSKWIEQAGLDATTNYECYKGLYSSHNDHNYFEIAHSFKRLFANKNLNLYNFVDNHDVNRISSVINDRNNLYPLYTLLYTMPGMPSIYYGSEWEIKGVRGHNTDKDLRPNIDVNDMNSKYNGNLPEYLSKLGVIRNSNDDLKYGKYRQVSLTNTTFAFERYTDNSGVIIALNNSNEEASINLSDVIHGKYIDLLNNNEEITIDNHNSNVMLKPNWSRILKRA